MSFSQFHRESKKKKRWRGSKKWARSKEKHHEHTNVNALRGKHAKVLKTIPAHIGVGVVKVGGDTWSARSVDQKEILAGVIVEIIEIKGSCLVVKSL